MTATWKEEPQHAAEEHGYGLDVVNVRLVHDSPIYTSSKLDSPLAIAEAVGDVMRRFDREVLAVVNLNADGGPINVNFASMGTVNYTLASGREILKSSILSGASKVMLLHNHPSGDPSPSEPDTVLTDTMNKAFALMGIELVDHVVVGDRSHGLFSYREKGIMKKPVMHNEKEYLDFDFSRKDFSDAFEMEAQKQMTKFESSEDLLPMGYNARVTRYAKRPANLENGPMEFDEFFSALFMKTMQLPQDFFEGVRLEAHAAPRGSGMKYDSFLIQREGSKTSEQIYVYPYYRQYLKCGSVDSACGAFAMDHLMKQQKQQKLNQEVKPERRANTSAPRKWGPKL